MSTGRECERRQIAKLLIDDLIGAGMAWRSISVEDDTTEEWHEGRGRFMGLRDFLGKIIPDPAERMRLCDEVRAAMAAAQTTAEEVTS